MAEYDDGAEWRAELEIDFEAELAEAPEEYRQDLRRAASCGTIADRLTVLRKLKANLAAPGARPQEAAQEPRPARNPRDRRSWPSWESVLSRPRPKPLPLDPGEPTLVERLASGRGRPSWQEALREMDRRAGPTPSRRQR